MFHKKTLLLFVIVICAGFLFADDEDDLPLTSNEDSLLFGHFFDSFDLKLKTFDANEIAGIRSQEGLPPDPKSMRPEKINIEKLLNLKIGGNTNFDALYAFNNPNINWTYDTLTKGKQYKYLKGAILIAPPAPSYNARIGICIGVGGWQLPNTEKKILMSPTIVRWIGTKNFLPLYNFRIPVPERANSICFEVRGDCANIYFINLRLTNDENNATDKRLYEIERKLHELLNIDYAFDFKQGNRVRVGHEESRRRMIERLNGKMDADIVHFKEMDSIVPENNKDKPSIRKPDSTSF